MLMAEVGSSEDGGDLDKVEPTCLPHKKLLDHQRKADSKAESHVSQRKRNLVRKSIA